MTRINMFEISLLLLLVAGTLHVQGQKPGCPPREDIKPCTCKLGKDKMPWAVCDGIPSLKTFQRAVQGMKGYRFVTFYLENSNIGVLPAEAFRGLEIESLNVLATNITALSESPTAPPFIGLERSLQSLEIKDCFLTKQAPLTRISLSHLKKLTLLQLEGNVMPAVGNDWFESGPYGLRDLYLLVTYSKTVGSHAFFALQNLRKLSMTGGKIEAITREMLPMPALYLEALDFSNNRLTTLAPNQFSKMPALQEIYLDDNAFTTLDEVVLAPVWSQLNHVFYDGNPLVCDQNLAWVYKYRLPESLQGACANPDKLRGRKLNSLLFIDLQ